MRAISLWQPWATAIALGLKTIETRHWSTTYRGPLAIHAAKRWTVEEREFARESAETWGAPFLATPPLGCIVAVVELIACERSEALVRSGISPSDTWFGNFGPGRFGWRLANIRAIAEPLPYRGAQGFFDVSLDAPEAQWTPPQGQLL